MLLESVAQSAMTLQRICLLTRMLGGTSGPPGAVSCPCGGLQAQLLVAMLRPPLTHTRLPLSMYVSVVFVLLLTP